MQKYWALFNPNCYNTFVKKLSIDIDIDIDSIQKHVGIYHLQLYIPTRSINAA